MKEYLIHSLLSICIIGVFLIGQWWGQKTVYIKTADIMFTRCNSNSSQWCLDYNQYQTIIEQLSVRRWCGE